MPIDRFCLAFLALLPGLVLAASPSMQDASQLFRQGQHTSALAKIDAYLAANPKDAQGRFLKGLILTELNRYQEAIKVFSELTEDYPELPEPYNNLAVLYAAQGQYERAKQSLEQAIRTHPSYTTAHENLGDIYAKMASLAYDKALQLDQSNVSAQTKLALIKELFGPPHGAEAPRTPAPAKTAAAAKSAPAKQAVAKNPEPVKKDAPAKAEASTGPGAQAADAGQGTGPAAPGVESAIPAQDKATSPGKTPSAAEAKLAIEKLLKDWAQAWSRKDVASYLAFYAPNFELPRGQDRAAWEAQRRQRLESPAYIKVEVSKWRIELRGDKARVSFRQHYEAPHMKGTYHKTLGLELQDGAWKIVSER